MAVVLMTSLTWGLGWAMFAHCNCRVCGWLLGSSCMAAGLSVKERTKHKKTRMEKGIEKASLVVQPHGGAPTPNDWSAQIQGKLSQLSAAAAGTAQLSPFRGLRLFFTQ